MLYNTLWGTLPDCLFRRKLQPRSSQFIRKYSVIHRCPQIRISDKPSHRGHRPLLLACVGPPDGKSVGTFTVTGGFWW